SGILAAHSVARLDLRPELQSRALPKGGRFLDRQRHPQSISDGRIDLEPGRQILSARSLEPARLGQDRETKRSRAKASAEQSDALSDFQSSESVVSDDGRNLQRGERSLRKRRARSGSSNDAARNGDAGGNPPPAGIVRGSVRRSLVPSETFPA